MATELMVAVEAFVGTLEGDDLSIKRGLQFPSDHRIVKAFPKFFVAHALGEEAVVQRRGEIERAMEALRAKQAADLRAARIVQGTRPDSADDLTVESAKRAARADHDLELVHDAVTGLVIGARSKQGHIMTS